MLISVLHRAISKHWAPFFATFRFTTCASSNVGAARGRAPTRSAARGLWGQTRWRNNGGLQTFLQTFPNLACFSPSFSKESFGGFVEFQRVTRVPNPKGPFPNFSSRPPPFGLVPNAVAPHSADSAVAIRVCSAVRRVAGLRGARSGLNLNSVSQNPTIARIRFQRKPKGEKSRKDRRRRFRPTGGEESSVDERMLRSLQRSPVWKCAASRWGGRRPIQ